MNLNTLIEFRHGVYQSFKQARDALFNLAAALVSEDRAQSLPELSLSPSFERKWSRIYEAWKMGSSMPRRCNVCLSRICRSVAPCR